ncbi:MAG TPA: type III-A CRISPR-associated protein Cas10/Csm1 [Exilispira sp.]|nr:type III-A CRISPR-associated protein Cas10/Csm1 [Exilispira sp.]
MGKYAHDPNLQEIVTASLLHDIGKFYQRASESDSLDNYYKENYCVDRGSYSSYLHAGFTAKFFDEQKGIFSCFENYEAIRDISATHHRPNTIFQKIISAADRASAGFDRVESETSQDYKRFREVPLRSLFSMIKFSENNNVAKTVYPVNYLIYDNVFPKEIKNENINDAKKYKNLYDQFIKELSSINADDYVLFESYLIRMLEKYLWSIPSATNDQTKDISLYDHSYTTASIASTLYIYLKNAYDGDFSKCEKLDLLEDQNIKENMKFAKLLKVDVSGIQNYIYDIKKTTYSSKILRARSFEVAFMLKAIAQKIKDELGLDQVNILFEGGGNLQLIIPNNKIFEDKLEKVKEEIEEYVFEKYFGELNFVFSISDEISLSDFNISRFTTKVRTNIENKSEISKSKKLQNLLRKKGHVFHDIYEKLVKKTFENFSICPLCEKRPSNQSNNENLCDFCHHLVDIGREITKTDCFILTKKATKYNLIPDIFIDLRENNSIFDYIKNKKQEEILQVFAKKKDSYGLRLSNPYHVPEKINIDEKGREYSEVLTFEELGENSCGTKKIAMLKGDVNDLGAIFWFGMKKMYNNSNKEENILSLSRYSSLSRMFDYFFSEILVNIIENKRFKYTVPKINKKRVANSESLEKENGNENNENNSYFYDDRIYVVYSGGDDFVLVGCWDAIFEFAKDLHREFKRYTGENKEIEFSCAMEIFNPKTPPLYMANICEESLSEVKKHKKEFKYVSVFGEKLSWEEYEKAIENGKKIIEYMNSVTGCSRSFIYKMLKIARMKEDFEIGKDLLKNAKWGAMFSYYFARNIAEKNSKNKEKVKELEDFFYINILGENVEENYKKKGGITAIQYALQATRE